MTACSGERRVNTLQVEIQVRFVLKCFAAEGTAVAAGYGS